ncbi:hypothetical protein UFOVP820_52 [uncultured Caudovirales phage]|uniref:Uncharacterized protein n=1 Tax=uncultured Caudovirales phage TaxID=2100421 RepID=A0A6J5P7Q2_9CAUD|nr:hypothetical protein UFOVP820_52 [uncultured Caudovirales phage]
MSRYVRTPSKIFTFDGDTITVTLKPLTALDLAQMSDLSTRAEEVRLMGDVLERNVLSVSGLKDADGNSIDVPTLCREAYFVHLAADIFKSLVELSQPANP